MSKGGGQAADRRGAYGGLLVLVIAAGAVVIGDWLFAAHLGSWPPTIIALLFFGLDIPLALLVALAIRALQRPNLLGVLLAAAVPLVMLAASSAKFVMLGRSALFSDAALLLDLRRTLEPRQALLTDLTFGVVLLAFLANMRIDRSALRAWVLPGLGLAGLGAAILVLPHGGRWVDRGLGLLPHRVSDFPFYGHFVTAAQDAAEERAMRRAVLDVPTAPLLRDRLVVPLDARNLHVIVVESLIDPLWLTGFSWPPEPLSPLFGRWRSDSLSTAVVPVFGNRSSDTEFEVLCGLPAAGGRGGRHLHAHRHGGGAGLPATPAGCTGPCCDLNRAELRSLLPREQRFPSGRIRARPVRR
jgi:hypothetical protein